MYKMYLQDYTYIQGYRVFVSELWLQSLYVDRGYELDFCT